MSAWIGAAALPHRLAAVTSSTHFYTGAGLTVGVGSVARAAFLDKFLVGFDMLSVIISYKLDFHLLLLLLF